ncbi:restriction endonuclease [Alteromonas macleodii]|uniref:Restriction endonuclease type IV Mrr domain-containing protein n=1 Tax=Alteromonas macleodii TaxID=28108 RepID=A0A6T9XYX5_ALTMA|nr:restriction endonuclease [Alteromonas macleodii]CAB9493888.1 conserved protein of unknown function [Alteromonas macleodii]
MRKILDYSDFIRSTGHQDRFKAPVGATQLFFDEVSDDICPFCSIKTNETHFDSSFTYPDWLGGGYYDAKETVKKCPKCGWWRLRCNKVTTGDIDARSVEVTSGILKQYQIDDKNIPIRSLQEHLDKHNNDVIHIHDKSMEKLVQSVFREHFSCDVELVGKSHDGGIDLMFVDSDSPIVVQVKRRKKLEHIESVSCIREFLGATLLAAPETVLGDGTSSNVKNCIYVSTCSKFSKPAKKAAQTAIEKGHVESYELYDFQRFCDVLKLYSGNNEPWKSCLRNGW